jgi:uncharacterized protein YlxP (DUF503 family)
MLIGTIQIELFLPGAGSLKEKRFVLKSIKTKIRNLFNVSIAEVDFLDKWQRSILGIACVANNKRFIDETLSKVMGAVAKEDRIEIIDQVIEIF